MKRGRCMRQDQSQLYQTPKLIWDYIRYSKALESFTFLRPSPVSALLAARDFIYAHFQLETECRFMEDRRNTKDQSTDQSDIPTRLGRGGRSDPEKLGVSTQQIPLYHISRTNYFQRLSQTFKDARSFRALICASTAMTAQQLTGINTIGKEHLQ